MHVCFLFGLLCNLLSCIVICDGDFEMVRDEQLIAFLILFNMNMSYISTANMISFVIAIM